jgi:acyl-coenzyme A synthetase/AMP-(fatty) acid ligase
MPHTNRTSLRASILTAGNLSARVDMGTGAVATWGELAGAAAFALRQAEFRGLSVFLETPSSLRAAEAMIQFDGVVRRMVLYPPDMSRDHLAYLASVAETDLIVTENQDLNRIIPKRKPAPQAHPQPGAALQTEWILLTSGTTGIPKLVQHTLASLTGAIAPRDPSSGPVVWSTFYDIRRYGGLQIFLRAALTGSSLILADPQESLTDFLVRAGERGVTHISGTPSQWRRVLMSAAANALTPSYIRLSGEIADQAILNQLQSQYPNAEIAHAFASTEAGVVLEVNDVAMGIPTDSIGYNPNVETKVVNGTLRVRSSRTASAYLGKDAPPLQDLEGFVDTGDVLEERDGRYYFAGRRDGTINVAGLKVHPEEVEAVLNRHPDVSMSLVRRKKSSITGALVVADVVLKPSTPSQANGDAMLQKDILQFCRDKLAHYKVPVVINFVPAIDVADSGKLIRRDA